MTRQQDLSKKNLYVLDKLINQLYLPTKQSLMFTIIYKLFKFISQIKNFISQYL